MSKHLSILYQAGLLESRKEGRWIYYKLPGKETPVAAREAIRWVQQSLEDNPRTAEDAKRLKQVLKMDPAELCRRQCA
jgi:DNA-binding transcriptional ArsR family regulator